MTIYNPDYYHTWVGYNWQSYADFVADRIAAYKGCEDGYAHGIRSAYVSIAAMMKHIEELPCLLHGYNAFSLLCAWAYLCCDEYDHDLSTNDYNRAMHDTMEACYSAFINDYVDTPEVQDVYAYIVKLRGDCIYCLYSDARTDVFTSQINDVFLAMSVKGPHGKQRLNIDLGIGTTRVLMGACVVQVIISPYEDEEKKARIAALCKVLHKVFS
jgi:hypothetical protein